jgi:NTE family protein
VTTGAPMTDPTIGLALSGGGSRAMAFHLGCMRALHELGILQRVKILSTVSGGSVIGALYGAFDEPFPEFEARVRTALMRGLVGPTIRTAFLTSEGVKALLCFGIVGLANLVLRVTCRTLWLLSFLAPPEQRSKFRIENWHLPLRRFASRTTIFRRTVEYELFKGLGLKDIKSNRPFVIINAAELRTGSAFYFTAKDSGSWRLGKLATSNTAIADAVTASAAYPLFLPALEVAWPFNKKDGSRRVERILLTDGGVYDNLGLAPLWPDRDPAISLNVNPVDMIICCRAGYGLRHDPPSQFLVARLSSAFTCILDRAQNAAMNRLLDLRQTGKLRAAMIPYLGQDDSRLKFSPPDLITREETYGYPTDFFAMTREWIDRLSKRGEQLTKALLAEHTPNLIQTGSAARKT